LLAAQADSGTGKHLIPNELTCPRFPLQKIVFGKTINCCRGSQPFEFKIFGELKEGFRMLDGIQTPLLIQKHSIDMQKSSFSL